MTYEKPAAGQLRLMIAKGIRHHFEGPRLNGLEGAIVHFDAGRTRPSHGAADPDFGAISTLRSGEAQGFAYAAIGRSGIVHVPENMDWSRWGSHAGQSKCPATGRTGVSRFYVGIEVNSPGLVLPTHDPNLFVPWFEAVRDANGAPALDRLGRATVKNPDGELYKSGEIVSVSAGTGNIHKGAYVPFSAAQMQGLVDLLFFLRRTYPSTFRLDRVFGHDEVAPTRKCDPGGCLVSPGGAALTMADFRSELQRRWAEGGGQA